MHEEKSGLDVGGVKVGFHQHLDPNVCPMTILPSRQVELSQFMAILHAYGLNRQNLRVLNKEDTIVTPITTHTSRY